MTREAGTIRERIFQALIKRYTADQEEALVQIDALLRGDVVPGHYALTEDVDKILGKVASAAEKMAILRRHYGYWHKIPNPCSQSRILCCSSKGQSTSKQK